MTEQNLHLHLSERPVMSWTSRNEVSVCGNAFWGSEMVEGEQFADLVFEQTADGRWEHLLTRLNGVFVLVCKQNNMLYTAVDRIRSIPLFYALQGNSLHVSDDANRLREEVGLTEIEWYHAAEFLNVNYMTGDRTLYPEIKQLQAGESIIFDLSNNITATPQRYFEFDSDDSENRNRTDQELIEELDQTHFRVFERLAESLDGRQAVIPLSGGFDSRLIAVMLERVGYDNVLYFTYGQPGNWESSISKEIADYYGRPWIFIEENWGKWADWFKNSDRKEYTPFADNLCSYAHIQDLPIVKELLKDDRVNSDGVFLPGHSGGFMSGSHTPAHFLGQNSVQSDHLINFILSKNYKNFPWQKASVSLGDEFRHRIHQLLEIPGNAKINPEKACQLYEKWVWQERQAKFIVNALRVYEFWGYEWRLPLWDNEMMDFWLTVSPEKRDSRNLYRKYIEQKHDLPVTEANSLKLKKVNTRYNPFANAHYGRFVGHKNLFGALTTLVKDVIPLERLPFSFIPKRKPVLLERIHPLIAMTFLAEILERTGSRISEPD